MDEPLLRLALVGPLPPPEGGMANQCRQLASLLGQSAVHVEVVRTNAEYRPAWLGRVRWLRAPGRLLPYLHSLWRATGRAEVVHLFANSGWSWHLVAAPAIVVCRLRGRPIVVNYRGGGAADFLDRAPRWVRSTLASADSRVVPSGFLREVFGRFQIESHVIPNIVDSDLFHPSPRARQTANAAHIVITRNLEAIYDVATAIRALALLRQQLPGARLTVAGAGPEKRALEQLVESLHLQGAVSFAGRLKNTEVADLYRSAEVMLNPSRIDNMPNSVLEAFASGVVVVSTNVGGVPFIAQDERNALLFPPGDEKSCAAALYRALTDQPLAARLRAAALTDAADYSWERVRDLWLREYFRLRSSRLQRRSPTGSDHQAPTSLSNPGGEKASRPPPG
jgi:glycosyltransferase involved in cell wall biosynthesis